MTALLQEFSGPDIDWCQSVGQVQELAPHQVLIQPDCPCDRLYLLLNGELVIALPHQDSASSKEFAQLYKGDMVGAIPSLETFLTAAIVQAQTPCQVLSIECDRLVDKLNQDVAFATRFYHVQAMLILRRIQSLMTQLGIPQVLLHQINVKESSSLFAGLQDSDLGWLVAVGKCHQLPSNGILQPAYRPTEGLYMVLEGALSLCAANVNQEDIISHTFLSQSAKTSQEPLQEIARIARGDVFGEMLFVSSSLAMLPMQMVQIEAVRDTEVLLIPQWRLRSKLLHDSGFAMRFYRILTALMASKYQTMITHLGFIPQQEVQGLGDRLLTQIAKAEKRFEWMEQQIQSKSSVGKEIKW